jgi:hypothetical protein
VSYFKYLLNQTFDAGKFNISTDFCKLGVKTDQYTQPIAGYRVQSGAINHYFALAGIDQTR